MKVITLWNGEIPKNIGEEIPKLTYYPTSEKRGRGTVIICPGGGYWIRADHEGKGYAEFLNEIGLDAFVLDYRVKPNRYPASLLDARRAVRYVRANAEEYGIDPNKIAIMGSSAGGHLSALTASYTGKVDGEEADDLRDVDPMPNAQILCYPVTDFRSHNGSYFNMLGDEHTEEARLIATPGEYIGPHTPPAFIWHTFEDASVEILSTYDFITKLRKNNIPTEFHVYPYGVHGLGLGNVVSRGIVPHIQSWAGLLESWLKLFGFIG